MASLVFNIFTRLFKLVGFLIVTGTFLTVLLNLQERAFQSKKTGLTSMLKINQQLVGHTQIK